MARLITHAWCLWPWPWPWLYRALLSLEVAKVQAYPFSPDQAVSPADWEAYIAEIAAVSEQAVRLGHGSCRYISTSISYQYQYQYQYQY